MSDEIHVKVHSYGAGRALSLVYFDPISGKKVAKTSGTTNEREAERLAGELEKQLRAGACVSPSRITWAEFKTRYYNEKVTSLSGRTPETIHAAFVHVERHLNPDKLAKLTPAALSRLQAKMREAQLRETSIAAVLRTVRAALNWAFKMKLLAHKPEITMPKRAKGQTLARSRAVTLEEHERMLTAAAKVRPQDAAAWQRFLSGLWLSGLRLSEAVALSWNEDAPLAVDLSGKRPRLRIYREAQKSGHDQYLPLTPDFAELLLATSQADRHGPVFKLLDRATGEPLRHHRVGEIVGKIGKTAGAVVKRESRINARTGKLKENAVKFATCHDYRRAFGCRWAKLVTPAILQRLMRHDDIKTTMAYYVDLDADELAEQLWAMAPGPRNGNILGNIGAERADEALTAAGTVDAATSCAETLSEAQNQGVAEGT